LHRDAGRSRPNVEERLQEEEARYSRACACNARIIINAMRSGTKSGAGNSPHH
jgi:hypothetical protein